MGGRRAEAKRDLLASLDWWAFHEALVAHAAFDTAKYSEAVIRQVQTVN